MREVGSRIVGEATEVYEYNRRKGRVVKAKANLLVGVVTV